MEMGLFPHSRSMDSEAALEEERRLCYVGMTRARKRLVLTWAKYRRRYGGGEQERSTPSWFLSEMPANLMIDLGPRDEPGEVDLTAERHDVRQIGAAQHLHRQDLQFARKHVAVFRRAGLPFNPGNRLSRRRSLPAAAPRFRARLCRQAAACRAARRRAEGRARA